MGPPDISLEINEKKHFIFFDHFLSAFSSCVLGKDLFHRKLEDGPSGFKRIIQANFGQTFKQKPEIVISVSGFKINQVQGDDSVSILTRVRDSTKSSAELWIHCNGLGIREVMVSWIACEKN